MTLPLAACTLPADIPISTTVLRPATGWQVLRLGKDGKPHVVFDTGAAGPRGSIRRHERAERL